MQFLNNAIKDTIDQNICIHICVSPRPRTTAYFGKFRLVPEVRSKVNVPVKIKAFFDLLPDRRMR